MGRRSGMDLSDLDWERLDRYVSGRGTPEELAELERWVNASRERRVIAESLRTAGRPAGEGPQVWDVRAARRQVGRRMRWFARPPLGAPRVRMLPVWVTGLAAAAILILAAGTFLLVRSPGQSTTVAATPAAAREVVTRRGERASFNLADGSKVMLAAESRLIIPAAYNTPGAGRRLVLEGEGYFAVTHDSLRPFRVSTTRGMVEDLGTEFVVTAYPETDGMQVVVASGRVTLRRPPTQNSTPVATMTPGDLARLDTTGKVTLTRVDPASYVAWTRGALVFDGTPLRDALPRLGRWYDVNIRLADTSLGNQPLTATFRTESVSQALDVIALSFGLEVERQDRTVILRPKRHPNHSS